MRAAGGLLYIYTFDFLNAPFVTFEFELQRDGFWMETLAMSRKSDIHAYRWAEEEEQNSNAIDCSATTLHIEEQRRR
jgi:hypothetical protein